VEDGALDIGAAVLTPHRALDRSFRKDARRYPLCGGCLAVETPGDARPLEGVASRDRFANLALRIQPEGVFGFVTHNRHR